MQSKWLLMILPMFLISTSVWSASETSAVTDTPALTRQYISDTAITAKIKSNLIADKDIKSLSISVTTDKGIVTLSGNVENALQKQKAVTIATEVKGVKSVNDELTIGVAN